MSPPPEQHQDQPSPIIEGEIVSAITHPPVTALLAHEFPASRLEDWLAELNARANQPEAVASISPDAWQSLYQKAATGTAFRQLLQLLFGYSPYLSQLLLQLPDLGYSLLTEPLPKSLDTIFRKLEAAIQPETDHDSVLSLLRQAKRQAHLLTALGDLSGCWSLMRVTGALSQTADRTVTLALRYLLWRAYRKLGHEPEQPQRPEVGSGIVLLAMGKLGAGELNYSSDIDLIFFYDPAAALVPGYEVSSFYTKLARDLLTLMEQRTADGYVFRTDLRLRPDPASTPLAVSIPSALTYYTSQALTWERAAMIKARPVASDPRPARRLMAALRRWVWRAGADFTALEDINAIKLKIDEQRPKSKASLHDFDVKLGRGGIRQIEFLVQARQLLLAGVEPRLRIYGTLAALEELQASGRIEPDIAARLAEAYVFFRTVEHRLQMRDDQQTHSLPRDDEGMEAVARSLGMTPAEFTAALNARLNFVAHEYDQLFLPATGNGPNGEAEALPEIPFGFQDRERATRLVTEWFTGNYRATKAERARALLGEILPQLLAAFARIPEPDSALLRFDGVLQQLQAGVPLFALIRNTPDLPDLIAQILGMAPALADVVTRRPGLLEAVLDPDVMSHLPNREMLEQELASLLRVAEGYEDCLDICRRWVARRKFQAALHLLDGHTATEKVGQFLAQLAEVSLCALQPLVETEFARRHGRFPGGGLAIMAMGNLASGQLTLTSDLDLVLVYRPDPQRPLSDGEKPLHPSEYWIKFAARLVTAITALTSEGRMYEVDLRLRPQGDSGPLAVSLEAFEKYQHSDAWTWEHMALTRARTITGDIDLKARIERIVYMTLTAKRDQGRLLQDVAEMRERVLKQHGSDLVWRVKQRAGGQIDIQFIAQYLQLLHAHEDASVLSTSTTAALYRLANAGFLDPAIVEELSEAQHMFRRLRLMLRLIMPDNVPFEPTMASPATRLGVARAVLPQKFAGVTMAEATSIDFGAVTAHVTATLDRIAGHFQTLIADPAQQSPEA